MNDLYRKTFDEIHASEALRQEVLNMTKQEKAAAKRQVPRMLLIAAIIVLALVGTAVAASLSGMQSWFSQQWTKETGKAIEQDQMGIITGLTDEVGVSVEADGITVTVDSVTRGEDVIWLLLEVDGLPPVEELEKQLDTLERPQPKEGGVRKGSSNGTEVMIGSEEDMLAELWDEISEMPRWYSISDRSVTLDTEIADPMYSSTGGYQINDASADGTVTVLLYHYPELVGDATMLDALEVTLELTEFKWGVVGLKEITAAKGPWTLNFSLPAIKPTKPLTTGSGMALGNPRDYFDFDDDDTSSSGSLIIKTGLPPTEEMPFQSAQVTPTGLTIFWADPEQTMQLFTTGNWYLIMADGSELQAESNMSMYNSLPDGQRTTRCIWPVPVNLEQAESLEYRYNEEVRSFALK